MTKILIVDDEADLEMLMRQRFRKKIKDNEYELLFATNGQVALQMIEENPDIDLVLSDINMPVMDGLTFLSHLGNTNPVVKAVMVSAYGDMANIRTAMNRGAFDFLVKPIDFTDLELTIQKTADHVKVLKKTLATLEENDTLKMYVNGNLLSFMTGVQGDLALSKSEVLDASVVFIDICGFTSLSEKLAATTIVSLLNTVFDLIVERIIEKEGYVDKFMGDAVMAVFQGSEHPERALNAAIAIQETLAQIPPYQLEGLSYCCKVSIGVNSGELVSGNIGSVSLRRLDHTVIGDTVNVAQRLQSMAGPGKTLISRAVFERLNGPFVCEELGEFSLKNRSIATKVYQLGSRDAQTT